MSYKQFQESIQEAAQKFTALDRNQKIRVISHLDADGICSCAILLRALQEDNRAHSISIVQQINEEVLTTLAKEDYTIYVFTDLGSGQLDLINTKLKDKTVFILDHHELVDLEPSENITQVNPHLHGIDGGVEISGAGVVFLFTHALNNKKDMAHIALVGAIGDIQEKEGFQKLNRDILQMAIDEGTIEVTKGLRVYGRQTRPLHKMLEYCSDPRIPGVSGSESGAIQFLHSLGIDPQKENGWRKMIHLTEDETQKLIVGIIMKRANEENPEDVLGNIYTLKNEEEEKPFRDAKEFATLLNSCGRLDKASVGIGCCLGYGEAKKKALATSADYKKHIVKAMRWYEGTEDIIKGDGYIIMNAKENILVSMIGTIASMISKSNDIKKRTFIMSLARNITDDTTKVSLRVSGDHDDLDLRETVSTIAAPIEGAEAGGHKAAAGAVIPTSQEEEFIQEAKRVLKECSLS